MEKPILDVENLSISFPSPQGCNTVVDNISFSLHAGKALAIVGESGSGKSITALSLMKLLPTESAHIESNSITYNGDALHTLSQQEILPYRGSKVAYIFQEPMSSLNPSHTCGTQVDEMLRLHTNLDQHARKNRVLQLFDDVGIHDTDRAYAAYPHQLSGGQLQRVMIAMALSCSPAILIADEPTTALDVTVQRQIIEVLRKLQRQNNMALIFISHDLGVVKEIADDVIVMQHGTIVEYGSVEEIFSSPRHPYTRGLIASRPSMEHRLSVLPTVSDYLDPNTIYDHTAHVIGEDAYRTRQDHIQNAPIVIEVQNLNKTYTTKRGFWGNSKESKTVLDSINLKVRQGETLGLVGESGCGKSTLANIIMGLLAPTSGSVLYKGTEVGELLKRDRKRYRKEVQIIFQDPYSSLNPRMKVGDAIMEPMRIHGISQSSHRRERATQLLVDVGLLPEHMDRYPHQFSGGQRQRINIARALAVEPSLIICDESVSALDVSVQAQVLNMLQDLKKRYELTYIFISHDISVIHHFSDTVAVMHNGNIVEYNDVHSVIHTPQSDYTKKLLNAVMV